MRAPQREINYSDFEMVDIRAGTIISARPNEKARKPAFVLEVDLGREIGVKTTSAQITELYDPQSIIGMQVLAVVNFPRKKVADVWSDVLVLGVVQANEPTVLITTASRVENGARVL